MNYRPKINFYIDLSSLDIEYRYILKVLYKILQVTLLFRLENALSLSNRSNTKYIKTVSYCKRSTLYKNVNEENSFLLTTL